MGAPTEYNGVILSLKSDDETWTTLAKIADWLDQFRTSGPPKIGVGDVNTMLRAEQKRLRDQVLQGEVGEGEIEIEESFDVELDSTGTNPYSVKNIYADTYVVNNYYGSDKESE